MLGAVEGDKIFKNLRIPFICKLGWGRGRPAPTNHVPTLPHLLNWWLQIFPARKPGSGFSQTSWELTAEVLFSGAPLGVSIVIIILLYFSEGSRSWETKAGELSCQWEVGDHKEPGPVSATLVMGACLWDNHYQLNRACNLACPKASTFILWFWPLYYG